jgi:large subunit ribosomal protein L23
MNQERLMKLLHSPVVSEKGTRVAEKHRQFVFKVDKSATKQEVRKAVELMFDVKVDNVQTSNVRGKIKRHGQTTGKRADWKKAYVTLTEGHDIDFMGAE